MVSYIFPLSFFCVCTFTVYMLDGSFNFDWTGSEMVHHGRAVNVNAFHSFGRMSAPPGGEATLVQSLATLLRNSGDSVLDGTSTLTLKVTHLQQLTRLFERYLLSRTHQHGFLALPSHPADTSSLLQLQLLFDILQKTVSLKLIHPPGPRLQSVVKIFPFKSLRCLELKRVPPHSLEGLRAVYSQLEVFMCSKSISSLEELLSLCGGDLSSAMPWLELHTLNFSYNSVVSLDESLSLLNVLKSLDLSHNKIQDCSKFLLPLSELEHLNLGYNFLQRMPFLGLGGRARLVTLILRNNELETINGVEQLSSLQHLDLAYNLLLEHSQLAPLSLLHCLSMLQLEGNPLYFHRSHRTSTVKHLSPKAALSRFKLDGSFLTSSELAVLPKSGQLIGQLGQTMPPVAIVPERGATEVSSGGGDMSDSLSVSEPGVTRLPKKKSKNRVRVRRASISEPSDTDHESKAMVIRHDIVLHHQKEIERMDVFREQLGEDWLRYQHHLDVVLVRQTDPASGALAVNGHCVLNSTHITGHAVAPSDSLPTPLLPPEPRETGSDPETESTLQWPGCSPGEGESTLETSLRVPTVVGVEAAPEEEELGVDQCLPLLVGVILDSAGKPDDRKLPCPLFLRVKPGHLLEVDMHSGAVLVRLELDSLRDVTTSEAVWADKALVDILSHVAEDNGRQAAEQLLGTPLQCLRCQAEFLHRGRCQDQELEDTEAGRDSAGDALACPKCGSDHVVQRAVCQGPSTSTPGLCLSEADNAVPSFTFEDGAVASSTLNPKAEALSSTSPPRTTQEQTAEEKSQLTETFLTARSSTCLGSEGLQAFHTPNRLHVEVAPPSAHGRELDFATSLSYSYSTPRLAPNATPPAEGSSPAQIDLLSEDFEAVDHRLKLYLDMEVFEEDSEELRCFLKMSVVRSGQAEEFASLLVVSDQRFYFLEITSEMQGQPSDWLKKRKHHRVADLCYLEVGLGSQSLHMQFEDGGPASYTLLVRHNTRCKRFFNLLTGIARELASECDSHLRSISTSRLHPKHPLWSLVYDTSSSDGVEDFQLHFFYLLAFVQRDGHFTPVTVLATEDTLYLLKEDHQWSKSPPSSSSNEITPFHGEKVIVQESQPVSCVSSIHLFSCDPFRIDINLYDEMLQVQKTWALKTESEDLAQGLVDWVKAHWEAMFGVKLITNIIESGI
uniref:Serine/threonine-protein kinase 11-interacting protein n=1 Tax=Paramormyrops kingsleyae TaxID=1676925 RepID=A0A3B3SV27_9TELE